MKNKSSLRLRNCRAFLLAATLLGTSLEAAPTLPTGGQVVVGSGSVSTAGSALTVTQHTAKLAVNWDSFSIGEGASVRFVQPSASSIALNRVTGSDASVIQGSLTSNGQVFLLNPSGVLFSKTAQVSVGGLVASTLSLSNEDFVAGAYAFRNPGAGLVVNEGNLVAVGGGSVALIAARVINDGSIAAERGSVNLAAGSRVTLNLGGLVNVTVDEGAVDALVRNGGAIRANGGHVLLTARGAGELVPAAISSEGFIEAQTLATGEQGEIRLLGGLANGDTVAVSGRLDVSAPHGGNGGFIETSAANVNIADGAAIIASAPAGHAGAWLLDPDNIEIVASGGGSVATAASTPTGTSQISASTLSSALNSADVSLQAGSSIDFKVAFNYAGTRNASLSLYAPVIYLGGNVTTSTNALGLTFGGTYASVNYAGTLCLTNGDRSISTLGGNVIFNGDLGGAAALSVNAAGGSITLNHAVTGGSTVSRLVTGDLIVEYQAGGGSVGTASVVDFSTPEIIIDFYGNPRPPAQFRGTQVFPKGTVTFNAGTLMSLNADGVADFYRPDMSMFSLVANSGGFVTFTSTEQVILIDFIVKSANWVPMSASGVSWLQTGALGKLTNLTLNAGSGSVNVNAAVAVDGNIAVNAAKFVNTVGASAWSVPTGKTWQVWSSNPTPFDPTNGDVAGSLPYDFKQYGATYGSTASLGTGNGMFYTFQPTLGATLVNTVTKVYNANTAAINLVNANYSISSGAVAGDVLSFTGTLPSTGTYATKNVGTGISITSSVIPLSNISAVSSTGKPVYGYGPSNLTATGNIGIITKKPLTGITGITAQNKVYDQGTAATLNTGSAVFGGMETGDVLSIASATGTFSDKNSATGKTVTISGLTLGGTDLGNYDLPAGPFTTTATIFKRDVTGITGITAFDKVYDGNTSATLDTGSAGFTGLLSGDTLTVGSATGNFVDKNAGTGKTVNITGLTITGLDAVNYNLTSTTATTTANITKLQLTSLTGIMAQNKVYDQGTAATLNTGAAVFGGMIVGDTLTIASATGTFSDKNSATGKTVTISGLTLGGTDLGNYDLPAGPFTTTATIFKRDVTGITGITANNKVYDGNTSATLDTGSAGFTGLLSGDTLSLGAAIGNFVDKNVGTGKTVNITGLTITGLDAVNYNLITSNATTTAAITKLQLTSLTGITANDKVYDRNTGATLNTGAAVFGGMIVGDTLTIASATGTFSDKDSAQGKTVTISGLTLGGTDLGNYDLPAGPFTTTASILKRDITAVTGITAFDKVYDGNTSATLDTGSAGFTGLLSGDTLTVGSATGNFVDKNAGSGKTVNITGLTISGLDAINYNLISSNATTTAAITKKQLSSITGITAQNKTYDGLTGATLNTGAPTFGGLIPGDTLTIDAATGNFVDKNAASGKTVNITGILLGGLDASNYDLPPVVTTTASILKATLNVAANNHGIAYTGTAYNGGNGIAITGFVLSEGQSEIGGTLNYGGPSQGAISAGTYAITPYGLTAGNYDFVYTDGLLTITGAPVVIDPHEFLPKPIVVPVYPVAPLTVQLPAAVGGLNYIAVPATGSAPAVAASAGSATAANNGAVGATADSSGEIKTGQATDRIDKGASRAIQGPTDVLVIGGGINLGQKPLSVE